MTYAPETVKLDYGIPPDGSVWSKAGDHTACRGKDYNDDSSNHFVLRKNVGFPKACMDLCMQEGGCQGIQYNYLSRQCQLWTRQAGIEHFVSEAGSVCYVLAAKGVVPVNIGSPGLNISKKCVDLDQPVTCSKDAGARGQRLSGNKRPESFAISVTNAVKVCAERMDAAGPMNPFVGWAWDLEIACTTHPDSITVVLGKSGWGQACVSTRTPVECSAVSGDYGARLGDDDLEALMFHITSEAEGLGSRVCAKRLDKKGEGWTLDLNIRCRPLAVRSAPIQNPIHQSLEEFMYNLDSLNQSNFDSALPAQALTQKVCDSQKQVNYQDQFQEEYADVSSVRWCQDLCRQSLACLSLQYDQTTLRCELTCSPEGSSWLQEVQARTGRRDLDLTDAAVKLASLQNYLTNSVACEGTAQAMCNFEKWTMGFSFIQTFLDVAPVLESAVDAARAKAWYPIGKQIMFGAKYLFAGAVRLVCKVGNGIMNTKLLSSLERFGEKVIRDLNDYDDLAGAIWADEAVDAIIAGSNKAFKSAGPALEKAGASLKASKAKFLGEARSWFDVSETAADKVAKNVATMSKFAKVAQVALFPLSRRLRASKGC